MRLIFDLVVSLGLVWGLPIHAMTRFAHDARASGAAGNTHQVANRGANAQEPKPAATTEVLQI